MDFTISRKTTSVLKGIAICAMLIHHLYWCPPEGIENYSGLLLWLGDLGKVCVSVFLFCSGYGLTSQFSIYEDLSARERGRFVVRRLLKFYLNYWCVFLVFVPISIFVFGRTFREAYVGLNIPKRIVYELFAINGFSSYNITWWFNKVIVILYILFPLLYWLMDKTGLGFFILSFVLFLFCNRIPGNNTEIYFWQFPFVLGMFWSVWANRSHIIARFISKIRVLSIILSLILLTVLILFRQKPIIPGFCGGQIDPFITCVMALMMILMNNKVSWAASSVAFLGKHSMNIYLIHSFFNGYWHPWWLHTAPFMRCGLNFVVLLLICLLISILLEWMKEKCGIYSLMNKLLVKLES